jgi:hypothetical protein
MRRKLAIVVFTASILAGTTCFAQQVSQYIGLGYMGADGTIVLHLTETSLDGKIAHRELLHSPGHESYRAVLGHVGPLKPGELTSVRAWPSDVSPPPHGWLGTRSYYWP